MAGPGRWKKLRKAVEEGYRRLAFGPVGDAVKLMMAGEDRELDYEELDLQNVAEIKRGKGTVEVKFFDRLEALDRLAQLAREETGGTDSFYAALSAGARRYYGGPQGAERRDGNPPAAEGGEEGGADGGGA